MTAPTQNTLLPELPLSFGYNLDELPTNDDAHVSALLDGDRMLHILTDSDPMSPDEWDGPASLVLDERGRRAYAIGRPKTGEAEALANAMDYYHAPTDWRPNGCPIYRRDPEELVARYMRMFWGVEVRRVSLYGHSQSDWAEGYVVLDNLAVTHGPDYTLSPGEAQRILAGVAKEWEDYFRGDVYGFEVTDMDGFVLDSCWGFYLNEEDTPESFAKGLCYGHVDAQRIEIL